MNKVGSITTGLIAGFITYATMSILYAALLASLNTTFSMSPSAAKLCLAFIGLALLYILPLWIGYRFYKLMKNKLKFTGSRTCRRARPAAGSTACKLQVKNVVSSKFSVAD